MAGTLHQPKAAGISVQAPCPCSMVVDHHLTAICTCQLRVRQPTPGQFLTNATAQVSWHATSFHQLKPDNVLTQATAL